MNMLTLTMRDLKTAGKKALIPFLTAGDPDFETTEALLSVLAENGADVIEIGVPFSDPLADGPVLQAASGRALSAGSTPDRVFSLVSRFSSKYNTPVLLLVYYNLIYRKGLGAFCSQAAKAGVTGLVVPDLPFGETAPLDTEANKHGLVNIRFIAPTTDCSRLQKICASAEGFIYCVAVTGVTGKREGMDDAIAGLVERVRALTDVPLAVGFGISDEQQARKAAEIADGVIVGSALVQKIDSVPPSMKHLAAAAFISSLKTAVSRG